MPETEPSASAGLPREPAQTPPPEATADPLAPVRVRDRYIDLLRALSLFVVVMWHWVFSVIVWRPDGPHASNPIATTHGVWALTWILQVMPVFFWVGGYLHRTTWESIERSGGGYRDFLRRRLGRLLGPTLVCLTVVGVLRVALGFMVPDIEWIGRGLILMVSPLWFLGVYVILIVLAPLTIKLHRAGGEVVVVVLAGLAMLVDLLRFRYDIGAIALLNLVVVWGLAHQLGYFYDRLVAAPRRFAGCLTLGGLFAMLGLTNMGLYPRSMVGVPGEQISNMAPPTLCIVALTLLQIGVALLIRPAALNWIQDLRRQKWVDWAGANAMTVFLWHLTGYAIAYGLLGLVGLHNPQTTSAAWWIQRPIWLVAPALATLPLVALFRRFETGRRRTAG
ncbi:MAG: acyltransferase family protein [Actinomycetota bacterium]